MGWMLKLTLIQFCERSYEANAEENSATEDDNVPSRGGLETNKL